MPASEASRAGPLPPDVRFASRSYTYRYTSRAPYLGPGFRVAPGVSTRVTGDPGIAYTMDVLALARIGLHPGAEQWGIIPEAGYTLRTGDTEHQWSVGVGLAWGMGMEYTTVAYMPRLVVDASHGATAYGMRNGLLWDPAENGFAVELAHQFLRRDDATLHDIRLSVSIDLALLVIAILEG